jgi:diguanylate cyclase (GGDEF)-like protein
MLIAPKNKAISRSMWVVTAIMLSAIWLSGFAFFRIYKADILETRRHELVQMNSVVTQHTAALFRAVQTDLNIISLWVKTDHHGDPLADPFFIDLAGHLTENADGLIDLRLVLTNGDATTIPTFPDVPFVNVRDIAFVQEAVAGDFEKTYLGAPIIERLTGRWVIPVVLKLPKNKWDYQLVVAAVDIKKLVAVQERWSIGGHGRTVLLRDDGTLLSRAPLIDKLLGRKFMETQEHRLHPTGIYISNSTVSDGVKRIVSYEYLNEFHLFVTVSRDYDEILKPFYKIRTLVFLGTAILTLFVLGAMFAIYRAQKALQSIQQNYQRLAMVDELTKVMNRRAFMTNAANELSTRKLRGENLAVLMIDIDHFKRTNDQFGHAVGDEVLKSASALWQSVLRRQDILGRLGGEEFAVALPAADMVLACEVAERLRSLTEQQPSVGPEKCSCTISIGVAILNDGNDGIKDLLKKADKALYRAKHNGRNRVEVYS